MQVKGSVAVVTGGSSGLGLATATALAEAGARVVVADLPGSTGANVASRIGARFCATDVTDADDVAAAIALAASLGTLRVAVNCAGIGTPGRVLGKKGIHSQELFDTVVRVNLSGTFNVVRQAAAEMSRHEPVDGERGVIVNTASVAAFDGQVGQAAYSASKGAVAAMTLPLARDLADSLIRVVTVAPGMFRTPLLAGLPKEAIASLGRQVPHPARVGEPDEFASLVSHIIANPMLNGEVIRLDGAIRMGPR